MSWGERSCKKSGKCEIASPPTCNVDCVDYESNGEPQDSIAKIKKSDPVDVTKEVKKGGQVQRSILKNFSKKKEFVVLKGLVFNIQSVSPKKIILKLKGKTSKKEPIPDGIFVIKGA